MRHGKNIPVFRRYFINLRPVVCLVNLSIVYGRLGYMMKLQRPPVARGDGKLGCVCSKAGTSHMCGGSAHSPGCMVNGMAYPELTTLPIEEC